MLKQSKIDAAERQSKLLLCILESGPISIGEIFKKIDAYGHHSSKVEESDRRKFMRDLKDLKEDGIKIENDAQNRYHVNKEFTYSLPVKLNNAQACMLRTYCSSLLEDESFPAADILRNALAKLSDIVDGPDMLPIFDKDGFQQKSKQTSSFNRIYDSIRQRSHLSFKYKDAKGNNSAKNVMPIGAFSYDKYFYLAAIDADTKQRRCYRLDRMKQIKTNGKPNAFEAEKFEIDEWLKLPFQYGKEEFKFKLSFNKDNAWRTEILCNELGELNKQKDGSVIWSAVANNIEELIKWIIQHGPGIIPVYPKKLCDEFEEGLKSVLEVCK